MTESPTTDGREIVADAAFRGRPVLVTGAAGFIGSHLVDSLLSRGARVRALDNFATGQRENLQHCRDAIELLEGDIRDTETCRRACAGVSWVFHQAALGSVPRSMTDPAATVAVNVSGTANLFTAARDAGAMRVVYASSSSVYGDSIVLPKREGQEGRPVSPYALSKRMNEELADTFGRCFGMDLIGLRYFNVYGPRQDPQGPYAAVIPRFFRACLNDEPPVIYGDGLQTRDFTFVSDAVAANLLAAGAPADACGRAYNIATGRQTSLLELAKMIREATGASRPPAHQAPRSGDVPHSVADLTLAAQMLRYRPSTPLEAGLRASRPYYESLNDAAREPGRAPAKTPAYAKREEP